MNHGEDPDGPGCNAPGVLVGQLLFAGLLGVLKHNLKHPGEILTQMVGCSTLWGQKQNTNHDKYIMIHHEYFKWLQNVYMCCKTEL